MTREQLVEIPARVCEHDVGPTSERGKKTCIGSAVEELCHQLGSNLASSARSFRFREEARAGHGSTAKKPWKRSAAMLVGYAHASEDVVETGA